MTQIAPELVERMVALVQRMAAPGPYDHTAVTASYWFDAARALIAELPAPVDPDIAEVGRITDELMSDGDQIMFDSWGWKAMVACLKRGRELGGGGA